MPTIPLSAAPALVDKLGKHFQAVAGRALYSAALRGVQTLQTQLIPRATPSPVDRGTYRAGWRAEPYREGDLVMGADLYNVELHAVFIEKGVRAGNVKPGRAMIQALMEWARRKRLSGTETDQGARSVAWAIVAKMKRRGIFNGGKGLHLLAELMKEWMPKMVKEEFERETAAFLNQ